MTATRRRAAPNKRRLTSLYVAKVRPRAVPFQVWDEMQRGLALRVEPSGYRSYKVVYSLRGRARWYHIGAADAIGLADARRLAAKVILQVCEGRDPQALRRAERTAGTFQELADAYLIHAKRVNKAWAAMRSLVERFLLPRWGRLRAADIARSDVKALVAKIEAPAVANLTLAAASAIFTWAIREDFGGVAVNPCSEVARHTMHARERVLSDSEIPLFWAAFNDTGLIAGHALRLILLTGQRPGEVLHMRREHVVDGFWQMPGAPDPKVGWPGTKNGQTHRVWLPQQALVLLRELEEDEGQRTGFVFAGPRGKATINLGAAMRSISKALNVEPARPHDLRRTFSTRMMELGFGRDALNRVTNHREGGIASVYDRHGYAEENKRALETTAAHILRLATGGPAAGNVVTATFGR